MKESHFEKIIADYKNRRSAKTRKQAYEALWALASNILDFSPLIKGVFKNTFIIIRNMVCVSLANTSRYNSTKDKAFNFFTTVMLLCLRKQYKLNGVNR